MFHLSEQALGYDGHTVLRGVCLDIRPGEKVSLLGRSGAGKSTLLKTLYQQASGRVALIPQDTALVQTLNVFHNVYMGRLHTHATWYNIRNLIKPAAAEIEAMTPLLKTLGLEGKIKTTVGELSGGQRQRVAVARAVHQARAVLLGDEPVSAVDTCQAREVLSLICEKHATVVLAMHDVELALAFSDRIIGLANGTVVLDKPASELTNRDLHFLYRHAAPQSPSMSQNRGADLPDPIALESY